MDFFDSFPEPAPPPEPPPTPPRPAWMRPNSVVPTAMAENVIIVRQDNLAIAIGGLSVYPNGFDFMVHIRVRDERNGINPFGNRRYRDYLPSTEREDPAENLRIGILFADGRRAATNQPRRRTPIDEERAPDEVVLQHGPGGGGGGRWDMSFWVHPLPPEGPLTFVMSWRAQGIAEVRHEIDGAAVLAAAEQAVVLWPDEPTGGWFREA